MLCDAWIKALSHESTEAGSDCCYCVLTPKHSCIQLIMFLRLRLVTHNIDEDFQNQEQALQRHIFCNNEVLMMVGSKELAKVDPS